MIKKGKEQVVVIDGGNVSFADIIAVARDGVKVEISKNGRFVQRLEKTRAMLMKSIDEGVPVYGVNTGYGKSCGKRISRSVAMKNGANIFRFHGCGTGEPIGIEETRAAMLCRIICLARGYSGVSVAK